MEDIMSPDRKRSKVKNGLSSSEKLEEGLFPHWEDGVSELPSSDDEQSSEGETLNQGPSDKSDESSMDSVTQKMSPNLKKSGNIMTTPPEQILSFKSRQSMNNSCRTNFFAMMSDEIILMILSWLPQSQLPKCALVCQRWRCISYDESLWSRIDVTSAPLHTDNMGHLLMRNPLILRMSQTELSSPLFQELAPTMEGFVCQVQYLDLSMAIISSEDLAKLLGKCTSLKKLSVEHCITDLDVCCSIAANSDLEVLNMSQCYDIDASGLEEILINCSELQELNLAWTGLPSKCVDIVCKLVNENIKKLNISGGLKYTKDCHVSELVTRCTCLTELDLSDCTELTENCLDDIVKNLHDVQELSFSRCYNIVPTKYFKFLNLKSLEYLNIFGLVHKKQLETLQESFKEIKLNKHEFSTIARPTVGIRRTSIWGLRVRN